MAADNHQQNDVVDHANADTGSTQASKRGGRAGNALSSARGAANGALQETRNAAQRVGKAAEANPLAAVGAGIAIGVAIGALLPRTKQETKLLGTTGRRLTGAASDAIGAARNAAQAELTALPLSKDAARAQIGKVFDQVAKAVSGASEAAFGRGDSAPDNPPAPAPSAKPKAGQQPPK